MPRKNSALPGLEDSIYFEFRKRQYKSIQKDRAGIWHVTDFAYPCMRKAYYSKLASNGKKEMNTESMSIVFTGEAIHQLLDSAYNDELSMAVDLQDMTSKIDSSDPMNVLHGECDAIYDIMIDGEPKRAIIDYKTWLSKGFKKSAASAEHVMQINIYSYILRKYHNMDVEYGAVIYLDLMDRMKRPLIFPFKLDELPDIEAKIMSKFAEVKYARETGQLPPRVKTWLCDGYCDHADRCFKEDTINESENILSGENV